MEGATGTTEEEDRGEWPGIRDDEGGEEACAEGSGGAKRVRSWVQKGVKKMLGVKSIWDAGLYWSCEVSNRLAARMLGCGLGVAGRELMAISTSLSSELSSPIVVTRRDRRESDRDDWLVALVGVDLPLLLRDILDPLLALLALETESASISSSLS